MWNCDPIVSRSLKVNILNTYLSNTKELGGVAQTPVAKLMAEHSDNLLGLSLLNQSVVDDNVLLPWETIEVSIAVGTALAAVDNMQLLKRELEPLGQFLDAGLKLTRLEGRELVKQRQDRNGVDSNSKDLDKDTKEPQVVIERVAKRLHDLEHNSDDGGTENNAEQLTLEHVYNPKLDSLLVEAELLLEHKGVVVRDRQRENRA